MAHKWRVVRVDWFDAHGGNKSGWKEFERAARTKPLPAIAFGVLARETDEHVTLIPYFVSEKEDGVTLEAANVDAELCIPRSWVKKITTIHRF